MLSELELLRQRITELEAKNTKLLRQIIEENSKREAENAEHKVRIEELEKNSADISAKNQIVLILQSHILYLSKLFRGPGYILAKIKYNSGQN
ncbi:unnamed protein product [Rhizophagus irregularis]|nr:unnamed protein product [Rhizophagus irregularis]